MGKYNFQKTKTVGFKDEAGEMVEFTISKMTVKQVAALKQELDRGADEFTAMVGVVSDMIGEDKDGIESWPANIISQLVLEIQKLSGLKAPEQGPGSPAGN